jgi:tetratricopeptide (TPR) repeat protein
MKIGRLRIFFPLVVAMIVSTCLSFPLTAEEGFVKGEIIDKVGCKVDPEQSYALYLPTDYSRDKKWPILYAFDPGARARIPMELFMPAAEKYGYIVVCSNNSRNGPSEPIQRAIWAVWGDTRARFSIDPNRIYSTGFSGGARVASRFHRLTGNACAGIIACGAGLSQAIADLGMIKPAAWYGIIGLADFNYRELTDLDRAFDETDVLHRVVVIESNHRWPSKEICTHAVEWMEVNAIKKGTRKKDNALVQTLYQEALNRAHNLELAGKIYYAADAYEAAQFLFDGLLDTSLTEEKKNQLKKSNAYKKFQKDEEKRLQREEDFIRDYERVTYFIENPQKKRIGLEEILRELRIDYLLKEANKKDIYNSSLAFRLLHGINNRAGRKGGEYLQKGDYEKAILFFEIAAKTSKVNPFSFYQLYNLACAYSLSKQKKNALKNLKLAVEAGFRNRAHMEKDPDLDNIRNEKAFKDIMEQLK